MPVEYSKNLCYNKNVSHVGVGERDSWTAVDQTGTHSDVRTAIHIAGMITSFHSIIS